MPDFEPLDIVFTDASEDDEPRLKIGDAASGAGVGQDCQYLATDGFVSMPNPPDSNGAATGLSCTIGNDRVVIACMDGRYNGKAGTLAPGDRAIVTNADACLKLWRGSNKIQLLASAQGMEVTLDANAREVKATAGPTTMDLTQTTATMAFQSGPVTAQAFANATGIVLSFVGPGVFASLAVTSAGALIINTVPGAGGSPSGVTINGVPLVVP